MKDAATIVLVVRSLVRPVITVGLVVVFARAALELPPEGAVAAVGGPMGIALGFWFNQRSEGESDDDSSMLSDE